MMFYPNKSDKQPNPNYIPPASVNSCVKMEYMKKVIEQLAGSVPEQIKASADAKYNFDNDSKALIEAFSKIGITLRDENGDYRNTHEVLKDMSEKYEQLFEQTNE